MKLKTLEQFKIYMDTGQIYFFDGGFVSLKLTKGEICDIIQLEYGIRPRKKRIFNKRLHILIDDFLRYILKEGNDNI